MKAGFRGIFVIPWAQTEVDGLEAAPARLIGVGAAWSWRGDVLPIDGIAEQHLKGAIDMRAQAARLAHRLVRAAVAGKARLDEMSADLPYADAVLVVTDGAQRYTVTVIDVGGGVPPLLMFVDSIPPRDADLWVEHHTLHRLARKPGDLRTETMDTVPQHTCSGVICFTPGTMIDTPQGQRPVEDLREGDCVRTKDSGDQEILWTGSRRMTGARLFAMPELRPIRIGVGALGIERPEQQLLVSPQHRMLIKGRQAREMFSTPEVLVSAKDLVNGTSITVDTALREVTYVHLLLPSHQILWANGVETESFHPASAALAALAARDRDRLFEQLPALKQDVHSYGHFARRNLTSAEAAEMRVSAA